MLKDLIAAWKRGEGCGEKNGMDSVLKKEKSDRINRIDWIFSRLSK